MKNFKFYLFEDEKMFIFYRGNTLGEAIAAFIAHRPEYVREITRIEEEK